MPMGGILPFKGIEQAMVIMHGSQGCSTYMRRHMAEHYNEPVDVGSSSLNEKGTVYGGEKNLKQGISNIINVYQPQVVGILTTCLAETIGEDVSRIAIEYGQEQDLQGVKLIASATPGYGGTQFEGYFHTVCQIVKHMAKDNIPNKKINIIVPNISPADIREIKRILELFAVDYILLPDFSDTMDRPYEKNYKKIAPGGTKTIDIAMMAGAKATIEMAVTLDDKLSPAHYLKETYGVPAYNIPIPIGIENVDIFIKTIAKLSGNAIPESLHVERGRLLDGMIDSHKYNAAGRAVLYGEPEQVYGLASLCRENGIYPALIATGSKTNKLEKVLEPIIELFPEPVSVIKETDFKAIKEMAAKKNVNIAVGHSDGKYLTENAAIPLVRHGFPIHDRKGGQRLLSVGYTGTLQFLDVITNTLLEHKYNAYRKDMYDTYYKNIRTGS